MSPGEHESHRAGGCAVDWAALGLDPGLESPCAAPADAEVSTACVHEHVTRSLACRGHVDYLRSLCPPAEWWCGPCASDSAYHPGCAAPLQIRWLAARPAVVKEGKR